MTVPIHEALAAVMADVQSVGKSERNQSQGFSFRGIDAVLNAVGPALRTHRVVVLPEIVSLESSTVEVGKNRTLMGHVTVTVRYRFVGPDGSHLDVVTPGEAMDSGDKAVSKAMSVAFRTALIQTLALPTDEPDADATTYERSAPPQHLSIAQADTISSLIALLDDDAEKAVKAWWRTQRFPKADRLDPDQAEAVIAHLERVLHEAEATAAADPGSPSGDEEDPS